MKQYTIEEVQNHNSLNDAWIVVRNDVLDVTKFITNHPGGEDIIIPYLGKDATSAFFDDDIHSHSQNAEELLKTMKIGYLKKTNENERDIHEKTKFSFEIDWNKPVVWQVGKFGKDYQKWVHTPIHTTEPVKLLGGWLESFTKVYWWVPLVFWIPILIVMKYYALFILAEYSIPTCEIIYVFGVLLWPFFEYCLHRFAYHMNTTGYWANTLHFLMHGVHHLTPMDRTRLVAPPALSLAIYIVLTCLIYPFLPSQTFYLCLACGVMTGYLVYDEMHFYLHHGVTNKSPLWLQRLKTHHNDHHYKDPNLYYGVSNSVTDSIFRTI